MRAIQFIRTILSRCRLPAFIFLFLLSGPNRLFANQTFFEDIPLADLVKYSEIILLVTCQKPLMTVKEIKIKGVNAWNPKKPIPPYIQRAYHFTIMKVIKNATGMKLANAVTVFEANDGLEQSLQARYYLEKVSKSPLFQRYPGPVDLNAAEEKGGDLIVFLRHEGNPEKLVFTVENAVETADAAGKVEKILAEPPASGN
jgi:hypothetical protein